jgi:hypothetical protein
MKKCKLLIASIIISFSLTSAVAARADCCPSERPPPSIELQSEPSFGEWFFSLFGF